MLSESHKRDFHAKPFLGYYGSCCIRVMYVSSCRATTASLVGTTIKNNTNLEKSLL